MNNIFDKTTLSILKSRLDSLIRENSSNMEIVSNQKWENTTSVERKNDLDMLLETMGILKDVTSILKYVVKELER